MAEAAATGFTIREIRPDEYEALGELTVRAYTAVASERDVEYRAELRKVAERASLVPVLVAVDGDERLLGGVTYVPGPGPYAEGEQPDEAGFRMLAVDPEAGGRGVGRALAQACLDRARADGRLGVAIYTRPFMVVAQHLYETLGFHRDPERDWAFAPGEWLWAYVLRFGPGP